MREESPVTLIRDNGRLQHYSVLWTIEAPDKAYLDNYLDYLRARPATVGMEILTRKDNSVLLLHNVKSSTSSYEEVMKRGLIYTEPISVNQGYEIHTTISKNPKGIKKALEELEAIGEIKLIRVGSLESKHRLYNLTPKQIDALKVAYREGYYSWPRKATLEGLAKGYGASRRGLQETLRKAEAKIMPELIKEIITARPLLERGD